MKKGNSKLSKCASELLNAALDLQGFYDDPISAEYGYECSDLVVAHWTIEAGDILYRWGYKDGEEFMDDFRERTTDKCAFNFSFLVP